MARLTVTSGPAAGQSIEVIAETVIGRGDVAFVVDDPELSRRHVVVRPTESGLTVEDLGSRNGTWVDGRRITEPTTLTRDSTLRLGTSEILIELAPSAETRVRPTPAAEVAPVDPGQGPSEQGDTPPVASTEAAPTGILSKVIPIAAVLFVAGVVTLVILAETGDSPEKRSLSTSIDAVERSQLGNKALLVGTQTGSPTGRGKATIDAAFRVTKRGPITTDTPAAAKLTSTFDNGELTSILQLTVKPQPDGGRLYEGTGTVTGGTGDYTDATGSFRVNGRQAPDTKRILVQLRGSVDY